MRGYIYMSPFFVLSQAALNMNDLGNAMVWVYSVALLKSSYNRSKFVVNNQISRSIAVVVNMM